MSEDSKQDRLTESYVSDDQQVVRRLSMLIRFLKISSGTLMFLLLAITFFDVLGRYVFNKPIPGAFEIIEFNLGLLIFTAFPLVTQERKHITVSLFDTFMTPRIMQLRDGVVLIASAAVLVLITGLMFLSGIDMHESGSVSRYMDFPMAPVVFLISGLGAMTVVILLSMTWFHFKSVPDLAKS